MTAWPVGGEVSHAADFSGTELDQKPKPPTHRMVEPSDPPALYNSKVYAK